MWSFRNEGMFLVLALSSSVLLAPGPRPGAPNAPALPSVGPRPGTPATGTLPFNPAPFPVQSPGATGGVSCGQATFVPNTSQCSFGMCNSSKYICPSGFAIRGQTEVPIPAYPCAVSNGVLGQLCIGNVRSTLPQCSTTNPQPSPDPLLSTALARFDGGTCTGRSMACSGRWSCPAGCNFRSAVAPSIPGTCVTPPGIAALECRPQSTMIAPQCYR